MQQSQQFEDARKNRKRKQTNQTDVKYESDSQLGDPRQASSREWLAHREAGWQLLCTCFGPWKTQVRQGKQPSVSFNLHALSVNTNNVEC